MKVVLLPESRRMVMGAIKVSIHFSCFRISIAFLAEHVKRFSLSVLAVGCYHSSIAQTPQPKVLLHSPNLPLQADALLLLDPLH